MGLIRPGGGTFNPSPLGDQEGDTDCSNECWEPESVNVDQYGLIFTQWTPRIAEPVYEIMFIQ